MIFDAFFLTRGGGGADETGTKRTLLLQFVSVALLSYCMMRLNLRRANLRKARADEEDSNVMKSQQQQQQEKEGEEQQEKEGEEQQEKEDEEREIAEEKKKKKKEEDDEIRESYRCVCGNNSFLPNSMLTSPFQKAANLMSSGSGLSCYH
jgi:hypothetical protein